MSDPKADVGSGTGRTVEGEKRKHPFGLGSETEVMTEKTSGEYVPYFPVFIDAGVGDFARATSHCLHSYHNRERQIKELQTMWTTAANPNPVLPLLSVRTGFDLFLRVMNFPPGSEVIMSALNIPDMVQIVRYHKLRIVPLDVSIETASPKVELLPQLVSSRTVAILIAHVYGKWSPMDEIVAFAKERGLYVVEDCAECFCGFDRLGHPQSDIALFSFGIIKFYTSFGGAIAKIRDEELYRKMVALHDTYHIQSQAVYLKKVVRYFGMFYCLDVPCFITPAVKVLRLMNVDYMYHAIKMLRGFPNQLMLKIRERPSGALLATMLDRQRAFSSTEFCLQRLKGEYVMNRLPSGLDVVGSKAEVNNYWLFPVMAENPDDLVFLLNALGVEAYRGATQLNVVEPHNGDPDPLVSSNNHSKSVSRTHRIIDTDDEDSFVSCAEDSSYHEDKCTGDGGDGPQWLRQKSNLDLKTAQRSPQKNDLDREPPKRSSQGSYLDLKTGDQTETLEEEQFDFSLRKGPSEENQQLFDDSSVDGPYGGQSTLWSSSKSKIKSQSEKESSVDPTSTDDNSIDLPSSHIPAVNRQYPHEAKYLIDHVVYLPIHKQVPFHQLNRMLRAIKTAVTLHKSSNGAGVKVRFPSKL